MLGPRVYIKENRILRSTLFFGKFYNDTTTLHHFVCLNQPYNFKCDEYDESLAVERSLNCQIVIFAGRQSWISAAPINLEVRNLHNAQRNG